jgi:PEP-CTERM/exosortase A-associated glycosyltransferase
VLHILHRSVPGTHGYAIRSKCIVDWQKQFGLEPVVITSPFQSGSNGMRKNPEYIDGIRYYRTDLFEKMGSREVRSSSIWRSALRFPLVVMFAKEVLNLSRHIKPAIIHAHSPFYCGLIASWVSKQLGIPSIYEIRGVWEDSSALLDENRTSYPRKIFRFLENSAMQRVDEIVVISEHLRAELLSRRFHKKIHVVPNGVDAGKFTGTEKKRILLKELNLEGKVVLGYIGTLSAEYEGLEYLINGLPSIMKKCSQTVLLLVGDGRLRGALESLTERIGVKENVIFTGRVPHQLIPDYYSIIDICVFPRKRTMETEIVTALKPLEAMAGGKAIIASNVGGTQELISDGKTGILFEACSTNDLVEKCVTMIEDENMRQTLGMQGRKWVLENREWAIIVRRYIDIYDKLVKGFQQSRLS